MGWLFSAWHGRRRAISSVLVLLILLLSPATSAPAETPPEAIAMRLKPLPAGVRSVSLEADGEGGHWLVLTSHQGAEQRLRPDQFAELYFDQHQNRGWLLGLFNITSPLGIAWVAMGLLGQAMFSGRMLVQWLTSERQKRSVVPVAFWWMSLGGASMLLVYFIWRRDIVGVLGQSTGWMIYVRNLWLIYRGEPFAVSG